MKINKRNILILIILLFSCDNPIDAESNDIQNSNNDPCLVYIQEIDCIDQQCQWITEECVSSDYYFCTINYGGLIDDCGICSGGITNIVPNNDKDICGVCYGNSTIDNSTPLYYDKDGDGELDALCGCIGYDGVELNDELYGGCCGSDVRDECDICGGDGIDTDGDEVCDDEEIIGCQDDTACNYDDTATDAGECIYVDGVCETCEDGVIVDNDTDDDTVCDIDEIEGCSEDSTACNYIEFPTEEIACTFTDGICDTCENQLVVDNDQDNDSICDDVDICPFDEENDADNDGVCETDEIIGCPDFMACNYNVAATDLGECIYLEGVCETCENGIIVSNDQDNDNICDYVDSCPSDIENDADEDGICETDEIPGCTTEPTACNYNENATDEVDCVLPADYDCDGNCIVDIDCNDICGGTAYYNYCGYCVEGNTGLLHTFGVDDCGICHGENKNEDFCNICFGDNSECTQGILTLSSWHFDYIGNWQNTECEGPSHYDFYNYICIEETCYDYTLNFYETDNRFIFGGVSWEASSDCNWLLNSEACTTTEIPNIEGTWSLDVQSYSPLIINGNNLCLNYDDTELNDFCFESIELLNNHEDCLLESDSCDNNILYLTVSDEGECSREHFSTDGFIYSNQSSHTIPEDDNLSMIAKNIILHIKKSTQ